MHIAVAALVIPLAFAPPSWPQFRGPEGTGAAAAAPPVTWSETKNVRWKVPLPGLGHSSPVVWGDRIFLTTAVATGDVTARAPDTEHGEHDNTASVQKQQFVVLCVARQDGRVIWRKTVAEAAPHDVRHVTASDASASPVTDGTHVWASFGSRGLYCLDLAGNVVWKADLGAMQTHHSHGEGSSPALHGDTLIVKWDHEGPDAVIALDKLTGKVRWRVPREEMTSWSSPLVVEHAGKPQVILAATSRISSYDLATGALLWFCSGLSQNVVATPVAGGGMVFAGSSYEIKAMLGIRLAGARGDITGTEHVVWKLGRDAPYVPSPLLMDGRLYFLRHYQGRLTCLTAATGKPVYTATKIADIESVYASLTGGAGRVYIVSREGVTVVLSGGERFQVLATNRLNDVFSATPALVDRDLILRGERFLYCLSE